MVLLAILAAARVWVGDNQWTNVGPEGGDARFLATDPQDPATCGRLCLYRKKINLSTSLAGQAVGIKEVDHGTWLVSFMQYDLAYIDLEEKTLQPRKPFRAKSVTHVLGTICYLCVRSGQALIWRPQGDSNPRYRRERAVS